MKTRALCLFLLTLALWPSVVAALPPQRSWTVSANNSVPGSLTHTEQYQEEVFRFKELLEAAGGTILISNGTVASVATAGAGDNIPDRAGVTIGAAGTGAWFVVSFANLGGGVVRCLFSVNDGSDPRQVFDHRCGNATWTGGTTSALPTVDTGFAYATVSVTAFMPYTTTRNAFWSSWRSTNASGAQSIRFLYKEAGVDVTSGITFFAIEGNTTADGGGTAVAERWGVGSVSALTSTALTADWMSGLTSAGNASQTKRAGSALWAMAASWTGGLTVAGTEVLSTILLGTAAASGRTIGAWVDTYAIPGLSVTGTYADSSESAQNPRRMNFGHVALYWPTATTVQ